MKFRLPLPWNVSSTTTEVISERYDVLHQFRRENEGTRKHNPCFNGRYELRYKYATRGGNEHSLMQRIRRILQKRTYPYMTTAKLKSALTYLSGELLPIQWKTLQIHGTAMGTKMAVAFANIFMAKVETEILNQSASNPLVWKGFIDDIFSL